MITASKYNVSRRKKEEHRKKGKRWRNVWNAKGKLYFLHRKTPTTFVSFSFYLFFSSSTLCTHLGGQFAYDVNFWIIMKFLNRICSSLLYVVCPSADTYQPNNNHSVCPFLGLLDPIYHLPFSRRAMWRQHRRVLRVCDGDSVKKGFIWWLGFFSPYMLQLCFCTWACVYIRMHILYFWKCATDFF